MPLLEGAAAAEVLRLAHRIGDELMARAQRQPTSPSEATLAYGRSGQALLLAHLGRDSEALLLLEQSIDALTLQPLPPSLYMGYVGVGWVAAHLHKKLRLKDDPCEAVDEAATAHLAGWQGSYDLTDGLSGLGTYALERPRAWAAPFLDRIVELLAERAVEVGGQRTWTRPPGVLFDWQKGQKQHFDLGLAHGVSGVVAFLAAVHRLGFRSEQAVDLLRGSAEWLWAQRFADEGICRFPAWTGPGVSPEPSRLAWCYGDLAVAAALLDAGRALGRADLEEAAVSVALRAARRDFASTGVTDAALFHGASGVAHLFHRLFRATAHAELRDAATEWLGRTLAMGQRAEGIAGFRAAAADGTWRADPGFLTGVAGIGLALVAATEAMAPGWNRLLAIGCT